MTTYATLCLGTRQDAVTWEKGNEGLGFTKGISIRKPAPSHDEIKGFFASDAQWLYLGGHFGGNTLYNEADTVSITFEAEQVVAKTPAGDRTLTKAADFKLHTSSRVILWGGCSVCSGEDTVRTMRQLFGPHVLLGFAGLTGWKMVDAMLGGGFLKKDHFFNRVLAHGKTSLEGVAKAWMEAARAGYGGARVEGKFRCVDREGQEWKLKDGAIVKGRMIN